MGYCQGLCGVGIFKMREIGTGPILRHDTKIAPLVKIGPVKYSVFICVELLDLFVPRAIQHQIRDLEETNDLTILIDVHIHVGGLTAQTRHGTHLT